MCWDRSCEVRVSVFRGNCAQAGQQLVYIQGVVHGSGLIVQKSKDGRMPVFASFGRVQSIANGCELNGLFALGMRGRQWYKNRFPFPGRQRFLLSTFLHAKANC